MYRAAALVSYGHRRSSPTVGRGRPNRDEGAESGSGDNGCSRAGLGTVGNLLLPSHSTINLSGSRIWAPNGTPYPGLFGPGHMGADKVYP